MKIQKNGKKISKKSDKSVPLTSKKLNFRNKSMEGYDSLDEDELWADWQKIKEAEDQLMQNNPLNTKKKTIEKHLDNSVIIGVNSKQLESIPLPQILHLNSQSLKNINKSDNFHTSIGKTTKKKNKLKAKIIVGEEFILSEMKLKVDYSTPKKSTKKKILNTKLSEVEDSMIIDDTCNDEELILKEKKNGVDNFQDIKVVVPHFYTLDNKVICIVEPKTKFSFHGKLKIKVLYGAVKIYGSTLDKSNTSKPIKVYSPRGSSLVTIESAITSKVQGSITEVWKALAEDNIDQTVANALQSYVNNLTDGWAVLSIQTFENILTNFMGTYCTHRLFPKIEDSTNYTWFDTKRAEVFLQANFYPENSGKLSINFDETNEFIERIFNRCKNDNLCRVVLAGGKNVGKSTVARSLVNRILETSEAVVFMDLDPGQAEFTPPGCISLNVVRSPLLGPNFTHLNIPYHQIYVGSVDVTRCITSYIEGIQKLVKYLNESSVLNKYPVVVNTMGFCKGIGGDIIYYTIRSIKPSDVLQIISKKSKNNYDQHLTASVVNRQSLIWNHVINSNEYTQHQLHVLDTEAENRKGLSEGWNIEPHQQREITMLAYLSGIIYCNKKQLLKNEKIQNQSINEVVPYQVPFSSVRVSLDQPLISQVLSVMNGNIVALCGCDFNDENVEKSVDNVEYPKVLLRASSPTCYGYGIIRGVDMQNKSLYVNTPLPIVRLSNVNCLIGCMPVPSGLLQLSKPGLPYAGGKCDLPTSRDPRRGYFRMRQNRNNA